MKYFLAIDTSTELLSVCIFNINKWQISNIKRVNSFQSHSVHLLPVIETILSESNISFESIVAIGVCKGPGSYTGIRVGITAAKTLSWALDVPFYSISGLRALVQNELIFSGLLVPIMKARKNFVYSGIYQYKNNEYIEILKECTIELKELLALLIETKSPVLFIGDCDLYKKQIQAELNPNDYSFSEANTIDIEQITYLTLQKYKEHEPSESLYFSPMYL